MLLLSVSTKKRKHNWEITKRDLTKLTSPSVRTKNDWSRRASAQKIGYLNSRTLRSVRLCFFSPLTGLLSHSPLRGPTLSLPMLTGSEKHERPPLTIFRSCSRNAHDYATSRAHHRRSSILGFARILLQLRRSTCSVPPPVGAHQVCSNCPSAGTRKNATLTTGESVA